MSEYFDEADVAIAIEEAENKPDRAALIGEVKPVAAIGTKGYSTQYYLAGKNWKEPEGTKNIVWLAPIPDVGTLLYTADQLAAAHAKGREEGLREALYVARDCATESGDWIAAAIERLLEKPPMNPARSWPIDKLQGR